MQFKEMCVFLLALLLAGMAMVAGVSAARASDYDFTGLSTPTAATAAEYQAMIGYSAQTETNAWAEDAFSDMDSAAIFFFNGHGIVENGINGGGIVFTNKKIVAANSTSQHIALEEKNNEIRDVLLAVYEACYTGRTSSIHGNIVDMSITKGVDNVIGFTGTIGATKSNYWSDQFWYRLNCGESIGNAANNAKNDAYWNGIPGWDGLNTMVVRGSDPGNTYLQPARPGAT